MDVKKYFKALSLIADDDISKNSELWQALYGKDFAVEENFLDNLAPSMNELIDIVLASAAYQEIPKISENPNPHAKIAFIIQHPFQYYIYKNVYRHCAAEAEFVLESFLIRKNVHDWFGLLCKFTKFLKKEGVFFRMFNAGGCDAEKFFKNYLTLVAHYAIGPIKLPCNKNKFKVRMMYGQAKDAYDFGPWLRYFDLSLNYGHYSHDYSTHFTRSEIVGNPRFDDWFSDKLDMNQVQDLAKNLAPSKKTLLYLPTYGDLSSLGWLSAGNIAELAHRYNVILKPHHLTLYADPKRAVIIDIFKKAGATILDDFFDLLPLLKISDVVLLDNSGAIFDAVLAGKPIALIDFLESDFFESAPWESERSAPFKWSFPMSYENSIEQRIKRERDIMPGPIVQKNEDLTTAIDYAIDNHGEYAPAQEKLRQMLFSNNDGKAGERAAELILNISSIPKTPKSFFAISAEVQYFREETYYRSEIDWLRFHTSQYINLGPFDENRNPSTISPIIWSIVIPTYNRRDSLAEALNAISKQKGTLWKDYEIIIVDDASSDKTGEAVKKFISANEHLAVRYVKLRKNSGPATARNVGILLSLGEFVCFTDDDAMVPPDWLLNFKKLFMQNAEIAGAGGWRTPAGGDNIYASFIFHQDMWTHNLKKLKKSRSFFDIYNPAGDTASMCYRKSVLKSLGGFNTLFRLPGSHAIEDWEFKKRACDQKFSLLYSPSLMVKHNHPDTLGSLLRYYWIRGWGYFLMYRLSPQTMSFAYRFTFLRTLREFIKDLAFIFESDLGLGRKILFSFISIFKNFALYSGKYLGALHIIYGKEQ